jgi:hypothetical protein
MIGVLSFRLARGAVKRRGGRRSAFARDMTASSRAYYNRAGAEQ